MKKFFADSVVTVHRPLQYCGVRFEKRTYLLRLTHLPPRSKSAEETWSLPLSNIVAICKKHLYAPSLGTYWLPTVLEWSKRCNP